MALSGIVLCYALSSIPTIERHEARLRRLSFYKISNHNVVPCPRRVVTVSEDRLSARDNSQTIIKHTFDSSSRSSHFTTLTRSLLLTGHTISHPGEIHGDLLICQHLVAMAPATNAPESFYLSSLDKCLFQGHRLM